MRIYTYSESKTHRLRRNFLKYRIAFTCEKILNKYGGVTAMFLVPGHFNLQAQIIRELLMV